MDWLPRCARKRIFFTLFRHFRPKKKFSCKTAYAIFKVVYQAGHIPKIRKIYGLVAETCSKTYIFHTSLPFSTQKIRISCKTAYAIIKVVYQASHIPKIRKIYGVVAKKCSKMHIFHTFFAIFGQKNFFFKNPASSVFWNHRKLP